MLNPKRSGSYARATVPSSRATPRRATAWRSATPGRTAARPGPTRSTGCSWPGPRTRRRRRSVAGPSRSTISSTPMSTASSAIATGDGFRSGRWRTPGCRCPAGRANTSGGAGFLSRNCPAPATRPPVSWSPATTPPRRRTTPTTSTPSSPRTGAPAASRRGSRSYPRGRRRPKTWPPSTPTGSRSRPGSCSGLPNGCRRWTTTCAGRAKPCWRGTAGWTETAPLRRSTAPHARIFCVTWSTRRSVG